MRFFEFKEHCPEKIQPMSPPLRELLGDKTHAYGLSADNTRYLGLHEEQGDIIADYYIGMRWIHLPSANGPGEAVVWVHPKDNVDYERLLNTCLSDPIVKNHLNDCYRVFPSEPSIAVPSDFSDYITPLLVNEFLHRITHIARKGIKRRFQRTQTRQRNRVKGRIRVDATIRHQLRTNSVLTTECSHDIHTVDCTENRILKASLHQCGKYIHRNKLPSLQHSQILAMRAFEGVRLTTIKVHDFRDVRHTRFFSEYRQALYIAKLILDMFGSSIESDVTAREGVVPPFYVNMPELFERYCEALLRRQYGTAILAGYGREGYSETRSGREKLRPDFLIKSNNTIADSKYKYWISGNRDTEGYKQLSQYGRHREIRSKLGAQNNEPLLQLIYPNDSGITNIDLDSSVNVPDEEYEGVFKYPVSIKRS